jgi:opacity protein-like surface antigen
MFAREEDVKTLLVLMLLTCACVAPASAQQTQTDDLPKFELFFGYTTQRQETERFREFANFAGLPASQITSNFNVTPAEAEAGFHDAFISGRRQQGLNASATLYLNRHFGLTADFAYSRVDDTRRIPNNQLFFEDTSRAKRRSYSFLFGPQVKLRRSRLEPFAHALFGVMRQNNNVTLSIQGVEGSDTGTLRLRDNHTAFSAALGGGLDIALTRHVAIRAIQVEYLPIFTSGREARLVAPTTTGADGNSLGQTTFNRSRRDGLRVSVGIVFR